MLTITITKNNNEITYRNVVAFMMRESSHIDYQIRIIYSFFPANQDEITISSEELNDIVIYKD